MSIELKSAEGEVNNIDGTSGDWEIQAGEAHIYVINKITGTKFMLQMNQIKQPTEVGEE